MGGAAGNPHDGAEVTEELLLAPAPASTDGLDDVAVRFAVDVPGFRGSLEQLVVRVQRGEVDVDAIALAEITGAYRARTDAAGEQADLREMADFLSLAARLVALKAARLNPLDTVSAEAGDDAGDSDDPGRRLNEYRLFKAAAEALLAEASEEGARSFLGLVSPDVIPVERLRIAPERLAAAFRDVLARLSDEEPLRAAATFSVEEKMSQLRERLRGGQLAFEDLFTTVTTRLEAVACFLALLELLRLGEAIVDQGEPFGAITVRPSG
jgi:segregation and condensation protein A